jgi:hypothetical protein
LKQLSLKCLTANQQLTSRDEDNQVVAVATFKLKPLSKNKGSLTAFKAIESNMAQMVT